MFQDMFYMFSGSNTIQVIRPSKNLCLRDSATFHWPQGCSYRTLDTDRQSDGWMLLVAFDATKPSPEYQKIQFFLIFWDHVNVGDGEVYQILSNYSVEGLCNVIDR